MYGVMDRHRSSPANAGVTLLRQHFIFICLAPSRAAGFGEGAWRRALPVPSRLLSDPPLRFLCRMQPAPFALQVSPPVAASYPTDFVTGMKQLKSSSCLLQPSLVAPRSPGPGEAGAGGQKSLALVTAAEMAEIRNALDGLIKGRAHNRKIKNSSF